jgi:hypothetical protein
MRLMWMKWSALPVAVLMAGSVAMARTSRLRARNNPRQPTAAVKKHTNKEQNGVSKKIYNKKHNAKTQPQAQPKP